MRRRILMLALSLASGCAARCMDGGALAGTWSRSDSTEQVTYTFDTDAKFTFLDAAIDGGRFAVTRRSSGAWFTDDCASLTLSVDGGDTSTVPYAVVGDQLTIGHDVYILQ